MGIARIVLAAAPWVIAAVASGLALRWRRVVRDERFRRRVSEVAGEELCADLDRLKSLVTMLEQVNYRMACLLHGKEAVDKAIKDAAERGTN